MNALVSVIVPVYKVEPYLDKCITSIVEQTYSNLEIILVDDGSPDQCPQKCDQWAEKDSRIKVIHAENGGVSVARNTGIDRARGEYLAFVDSDDWVATDLFERVMPLFEKHDSDIVVYDCNRVNENGENYASTEKFQECCLAPAEAVEGLLKGTISHYVWNKVFKRQVFDGVRFPEERVWEDMAVAYRLFLNARRIYCYPEKLYFYYTRKNSISKTLNSRALGDIFLARYEAHMTVKEVFPEHATLSLPLAALSARRLFDRSLWETVDCRRLEMAKCFLTENKDDILKVSDDWKYRLYYKYPRLYAALRILKHKIGSVVKRIL